MAQQDAMNRTAGEHDALAAQHDLQFACASVGIAQAILDDHALEFAGGCAAAADCARGCLRGPPADSVRARHSRWDGKSQTPDKAAETTFPSVRRPPQIGLVARALPWSSGNLALHSGTRLTARRSVKD